MSRAARSLFAFGVYVVLVGVALVALPALVASLLRLPPAAVGWARMVGLLALVIGTYDIIASRAECLPYIRASVYVRFGFAAGVVVLYLLGEMPMPVLLLGGVDVASAIWTAIALRS